MKSRNPFICLKYITSPLQLGDDKLHSENDTCIIMSETLEKRHASIERRSGFESNILVIDGVHRILNAEKDNTEQSNIMNQCYMQRHRRIRYI